MYLQFTSWDQQTSMWWQHWETLSQLVKTHHATSNSRKRNPILHLYSNRQCYIFCWHHMHRCNPSGISLMGSWTNELFKKPDRLVNACDNYYLSAQFFWLHLLTVFSILLHEACSFVVLQLGTGAKSRNLLEVNIKYKGVSWRYSIVKLSLCHMWQPCWCLPSLCCSIGGDNTLENITTLPSEFMFINKSSNFPLLFLFQKTRCLYTLRLLLYRSMSLFSTDILKKFNQFLKGFSRDESPKQNGFNMAVAGAKASYVQSC